MIIITSEEKIIEKLCLLQGISKEEMLGSRRSPYLGMKKHLSMYLLRHEFEMSCARIAKMLRKDRGSVVYGSKKIEELLESSRYIQNTYANLKDNFYREILKSMCEEHGYRLASSDSLLVY
ncbi:helix-turn-helix domain-containing protein [uncultured Algoriphagus sp.]|uniref:helix-turn-helix domain-containing protein n=1 Tax=uncultured Algoriphagus sp. TaxID=417365 RepID=UPI002599DA7D|nr:helix-turn-helix domain-containing protein [uncultured Algoriphagus sp.]